MTVHKGGAGARRCDKGSWYTMAARVRVAATEAAKGGFGYELPETVHGRKEVRGR